MRTICIVFLASITMWCCQTTSLSKQASANSAPYAQYRSLAEALRIHPALQVTGGRGLEKVAVRQFQGSVAEPLYVVNDFPVGNDYSRANQLLNMAHVKSIKVLKGIGEAVRYGSMASNGVIYIKTI